MEQQVASDCCFLYTLKRETEKTEDWSGTGKQGKEEGGSRFIYYVLAWSDPTTLFWCISSGGRRGWAEASSTTFSPVIVRLSLIGAYGSKYPRPLIGACDRKCLEAECTRNHSSILYCRSFRLSWYLFLFPAGFP